VKHWLRAIPDADLRAMVTAAYEVGRWGVFEVCCDELIRRQNEVKKT